MDRDQTANLLAQALALEARSFLAYVMDHAAPIRTEIAREAGSLLGEVASEEERIRDEIADLIAGLGEVPTLVPYPFEVGYYNYVEMDHLVPLVLDRLDHGLARFCEVARALGDGDRLVQSRLKDLERRKRQGVERIRAFAASLKARKDEERAKLATAAPAAAPRKEHH